MLRAILLSFVLVLVLPSESAFALQAPRGFRETARAEGVTVYARRRDVVQVIDPSAGARLRILHGPVLPKGDYATFPRRSIVDWWSEWSAANPSAFSVLNGQFFDTSDSAASALAFSIKANGKVYQGYGDRTEYPDRKKLLVLYGDRAVIMDYDDDPGTLRRLPADDILTGLDPRAAKQPRTVLPRTFIGIAKTGEILVFSSSAASQYSADRVLRMFGADPRQTMMLDGGRSSYLVQQGEVVVPVDARGRPRAAREKLPQIVGIESGQKAVSSRQ